MAKWKYPEYTRAGRRERAAGVLREGEKCGIPISVIISFLKEHQRLSDDEIQEAMSDVFYGTFVGSDLQR